MSCSRAAAPVARRSRTCAVYGLRQLVSRCSAVGRSQLPADRRPSCRPARTAARSSGTARCRSGRTSKAAPHNPRSVFESAPFNYTEPCRIAIVITTDAPCLRARRGNNLELVYWTDRDRSIAARRRIAQSTAAASRFEIPGQPMPTALYYYFEASGGSSADVPRRRPAARRSVRVVRLRRSPRRPRSPRDLLDIFDIVRLLRARRLADTAAARRSPRSRRRRRHQRARPASGRDAARSPRRRRRP